MPTLIAMIYRWSGVLVDQRKKKSCSSNKETNCNNRLEFPPPHNTTTIDDVVGGRSLRGERISSSTSMASLVVRCKLAIVDSVLCNINNNLEYKSLETLDQKNSRELNLICPNQIKFREIPRMHRTLSRAKYLQIFIVITTYVAHKQPQHARSFHGTPTLFHCSARALW